MDEPVKYFYEDCYVQADGARLFTVIYRPVKEGKYPTVITRTPYVPKQDPAEIRESFEKWMGLFPSRGYCYVFQHCRGRGNSEGDFLPYEFERADGHALQDWIRKQSFYNGEIFLSGASYTSVLQYCCTPFAEDVKGAVLDVMSPIPYDSAFRNGYFKTALMGSWYVGQYKANSELKKPYCNYSGFEYLPLKDYAKEVLGEQVPAFEKMLRASEPNDPFWSSPEGMGDMRTGLSGVKVPVMVMTGHADLVGGSLMNYYRSLCPEDKKHVAMVMAASDHGDQVSPKDFPWKNGCKSEHLGKEFIPDFFDACRGLRPFGAPLGKVTSYCCFAPKPWECDDFDEGDERTEISLGEDTVKYTYNPYDAPSFPGSITNGFSGMAIQHPANWRQDVVSRYTEPFAEDTYIRGPFDIELTFSSDCEDTGIYARVSIETEQGDLSLRDDINSLARLVPDYKPGEKVRVKLSTDWHSLMIPKGKRLRIDLASANKESFLRHTNVKGHYMDVDHTRIAHNTLYLGESRLIIYRRTR